MRKTEHLPKQMERPVLMNGEMVRAILDGRKTQTRRVISEKSHVRIDEYIDRTNYGAAKKFKDAAPQFCPYGQPGDLLWCREACAIAEKGTVVLSYRATEAHPELWKYRPSIHMPRWASRITLELTKIRVERLQEISEEDARAEGVGRSFMLDDPLHPEDGATYWKNYTSWNQQALSCAIDSYRTLWDSINGVGAWDKNPWVWAVSFNVTQGTR